MSAIWSTACASSSSSRACPFACIGAAPRTPTQRTSMRRASRLSVLLATLCSPAFAQQHPASAPTPATPPSAEPQRTTATFENWTLRCVRPENEPGACEVTQVIADKGHPVADTALGRLCHDQPMRFTLQVPSNLLLTAPPRLQEGPGTPALDLTWRR